MNKEQIKDGIIAGIGVYLLYKVVSNANKSDIVSATVKEVTADAKEAVEVVKDTVTKPVEQGKKIAKKVEKTAKKTEKKVKKAVKPKKKQKYVSKETLKNIDRYNKEVRQKKKEYSGKDIGKKGLDGTEILYIDDSGNPKTELSHALYILNNNPEKIRIKIEEGLKTKNQKGLHGIKPSVWKKALKISKKKAKKKTGRVTPYNKFISENMKKGMTMKKASQIWKLRKNLDRAEKMQYLNISDLKETYALGVITEKEYNDKLEDLKNKNQ